MRASRLLGILLVLQARGRLTAEALASEFEVSVRTIYRDIDHLSAAGVPVYADSGPGGGYELLDGYRTRLTGLTQAEAEALSFAALPGLAEGLGLASHASSARMKIFAALPPEKTKGAFKIAERFHLDVQDWYHDTETPGNLGSLAECVWNDRKARIQYESWTGIRTKLIDPLGLVVKGGKWYCVARSSNRISIHKVSKISLLEPLDTSFIRPARFDLSSHWRAELERFEKGLRQSTARVRIHQRAISKLERLGTAAVRAAANAKWDRRGWSEIIVPLETIEFTAHDLLVFGADLVAVEPHELRLEIAAIAKRISRSYRT